MRRRITIALAACAVAVAGAQTVHAANPKATGPFRIDQIRYEQGESLNSEYVVVKNISQRKQNLKDYRIVDPHDGQEYTFERSMVKPGGTVTLHTGRGHAKAGHRYWGQAEPMWNNEGDTALLILPTGRRADRCIYNGGEGGTARC